MPLHNSEPLEGEKPREAHFTGVRLGDLHHQTLVYWAFRVAESQSDFKWRA